MGNTLKKIYKIRNKDISNFDKIKKIFNKFKKGYRYTISYDSKNISFLLQHIESERIDFTTMTDKDTMKDIPRFEIDGLSFIYHIYNLENSKLHLNGYDNKIHIIISNFESDENEK